MSALILSVGTLLIASYLAGTQQGLDSYISPHAAGPFLHATCAVATKSLTTIGNYVCLRDVLDITLATHGIMYEVGLRECGASWDYLFNREFVDQALLQLFAHDQSPPPVHLMTGSRASAGA
jgi:hypothetical protein